MSKGTDDLLGRDAVDALDPRTHELDAATRHDEGLEAVRAEIRQELEHRLVDHLRVEAAGLRMLRGADPIGHRLLELLGRHAGVRRGDHLDEFLLTGRSDGLHVAREQRRERLLVLPLRMLWRQRLDSSNREERLEVQRLLAPQRPIVVEGGDALRHGHELRRAGLRDLLDELDDRFLRARVVPRRQRIGDEPVRGEDRGSDREREGDHRGFECSGRDERLPASAKCVVSSASGRAGYRAWLA